MNTLRMPRSAIRSSLGKEKGEKIFERASDNLAAFVEEVKKIKVDIKERDYDFRAY